MVYDTEYTNVEQVRNLLKECPIIMDYDSLSENVRELLFDINYHVDAMVGYADWHVNLKEPEEIYEGAFLGEEYWQRFKEAKSRIIRERGLHA